MGPSRWTIFGAVVAAVTMVTSVATAGATAQAPVSVSLKVGESTTSDEQAVAAVAGSDSDIYEVTNGTRPDSYDVVYLLGFKLNDVPEDDQLIFQITFGVDINTCTAGIDFWHWKRKRWTKRLITPDLATSIEQYGTSVPVRGHVMRRKVRVRIRCTASAAFGQLNTNHASIIA